MLGAEVVPVTSGNMTLKDATNEAIRDWCCHPSDTHYIIGSALGPHPYPDMVARLQSVISEEIKVQLMEHEGRVHCRIQAAAENASGGIVGSLFVQLLEEASGDADKAVRRLKTLLYGPSAFPDGYML